MDRKKTEMKKWAKEHMKGVENTLLHSPGRATEYSSWLLLHAMRHRDWPNFN